jgi:hypothetical protein
MTEIDIKNRRKEAIRNEGFLFRLLILLGAVRYKVSYDGFHGYRKTYKVRTWHPFTWIMTVLIVIFSIPKVIWDAFKEIREEFKEKTYYC